MCTVTYSFPSAAADRYRLIMQPERPQFGPNTALFASFLMFLSAIALSVPMFVSAKVGTNCWTLHMQSE